MHCLYGYVLLVLDHHGHPVGGGGDEDLDTELVVVGHDERGRDSKFPISYDDEVLVIGDDAGERVTNN